MNCMFLLHSCSSKIEQLITSNIMRLQNLKRKCASGINFFVMNNWK